MLTIKEIMDAWNKVYGEDMTSEYSGFISELEKIIIKKKEVNKDIKCNKCKSDNLQWLVWVDKNNKYQGESSQSENGNYWCDNCKKHREE